MSSPAFELDTLLAQPALPAPEGVTADFANPPNKNGLAWFVTTFCLIFATALVLARGYAKLRILRAAHVEEFLMLCAYGAYLGTAYAGYDLVQPFYLILVYGCAYSATLALVKTAILLDWCRMFVVGSRRKSYLWWVSMIIIFVQVSWGIACIILLNMQCVPHAAIWKFYLPSKCYNLSTVMLVSASVQVISDWSMILLPQKIIWSLQMNWRQRLGISFIFGVGLLASISATVRLSTTITFSHEEDKMYFIAPLLFWACAEMTCGFFILGVPCIPCLLKTSGLRGNCGSFFGISLGSSNNRSAAHRERYARALSNLPTKISKKHDLYSNLDKTQDDLPMYTLDRSEPPRQSMGLDGVKDVSNFEVHRKTETTVVSSELGPRDVSGKELKDRVSPWDARNSSSQVQNYSRLSSR
ncbi:hypothetical protein KCU65_g2267, partial [Aureobasidium melanogenum]